MTETGGECEIESVSMVEDLGELNEAPPNSIVILGREASAEAFSYRFDMGLRLALHRQVSAIVVTAPSALGPSARAIAERMDIGLLSATSNGDLAALAIAIDREIVGGADAALARAAAARRAIDAAEVQKATPEVVAERASEALGVAVEIREPEEHDLYVSLAVGGEDESYLVAPRQEDASGNAAVGLILEIAAAAINRMAAEARRVEELPVLSRSELLSEILQSPPGRESELRDRARSVGLLIDGWHTVVHVEFENLLAAARQEEAAALELAQTLRRVALQSLHAAGGEWHDARIGHALIIVHMKRTDPGPRGGRTVASSVEQAIQRLRSRVPELMLHCGIGSAHAGYPGLLASAAEARAALAAARTTSRPNTAVEFDTVGLRRMLIEWYSVGTAREAVATLLAPLDKLGRRRSEVAIRTLGAYLDNHCSLSQTAKALHLHRNSVTYRLERIFKVLDVDPDDPDERLLLQLACRARSLR
ncbi:MAG TPA: helix-turn-helix domain-containing protein [Solirubrobacteraceae bacterium]